MTDPETQRIAEKLTDGTDLAAASMLCALSVEGVEVPKDDADVLVQLERDGLVLDGRVTARGARVAIVLRRIMGVE